MLSPISPPTQARQPRSSLPSTRRTTSLRPITMGHGPTTLFMFWRCAINNAKSLDPQKIREAILSVKDYPGVEGTYNFDQNGDGLHGYNVVKNDNGKIVFIKHIDFRE